MADDLVLVTGGSGFLAAHCIVQLLQAGYRVRTTLRSQTRENEVRAMVEAGGAVANEALSFAMADLSQDAGWAEAAQGARFVLHIASPFPLQQPRDANELILPAREGALRVLRVARSARADRLVLTSSWAAVGYGHPQRTEPFTEKDWTELRSPGLTPYIRSKTIAEKAAWEFVEREGGGLELAVVNPGGIFGPVLGPDLATSIVLTQQFLQGKVPVCPRLSFYPVDVRDVADLHLRAMTLPAAQGERFLALSDAPTSPIVIAQAIRRQFPEFAGKLPRRTLPDWLVRLLALFEADLRPVLSELGPAKRAVNSKAKSLLGWSPRRNEEMFAATVESLLRFHLAAA